MQQYIRELLREEGHPQDSDDSEQDQIPNPSQANATKRGRPREA